MSRQADLLEAYHNILYVINNAPLNSYPKFGKNDVKKIPSDKAEKIIGNVVGHRLASVPADKHPHVELVLGYPGSGKTLVEEDILARYPGTILKIDYDDFRRFDSRMVEKSKENPLVADYFGQIPGAIKDRLMMGAAANGQSVLISAPALDIQSSPENSLKALFLNKGYRLNVVYINAGEELCFLSNFTRHFKARANNLNNPDGNFDIPRMVRPEVHRAISAGNRQNINEIVGMIGRGENVSLKMVDRDNREIPFTNIEAVPHIARRRERSPLNPAEIDRLVNELSIISDAIQKVGINGREKKILADFMQGALYSRLIERNIPSTMPMFLDNHQGR